MSLFAKLNNIKDQLPKEPIKVKKELRIKGNITEQINITDHAVERYYQRELNGTQSDIETMRKYLINKINLEGVEGYYDQERRQSYVAIIYQGIFIKKGQTLTTYISLKEMNRALIDIYIGLRKKGEK